MAAAKPRAATGAVMLCCMIVGGAPADTLFDVFPNPVYPFDGDTLFPNMVQAPTASFQMYEWCDCTYDADKCPNTGESNGCLESEIVSLTVMNFGTATGGSAGDIRELYFRVVCGNAVPSAQTYTMGYAGIWDAGGESFPAWTWKSDPGPIVITGDPCDECGDDSFGAYMDLLFYTDISGCPTDGATVALGPAYNESSGEGGIVSLCTSPILDQYDVPSTPKLADAAPKFIRYAMKKVDREAAAPGDTVTYTIFYGTPGIGILSSLVLFDTVPAYMHVLTNSTTWFENINPPADPDYDPAPGPPAQLRWTVNNVPAAFGRTQEVMFRATIDWGNGELFEPGSGDEAAAEGEFLFNQAQVTWDPQGAGCPAGAVSNAVSTVVKRYLFWVLGDQDVLFAPKTGMPDDEIIYSVYIKNLSETKTWWKVKIWDTVPTLIDVWGPTMGFEDPFLGWTMTPTPAAAGSPGKLVDGTETLLTWTTDMPPGFTLQLKFKGKLRSDAEPNDRILNPAMAMALGDPGKVGGTGSARRPRGFKHEATVVLRTTFISYVGYAGSDDAWTSYDDGCDTPLYFICFYPLNKATDFTVYRKLCCAGGAPPCDPACTAFALDGGVSPRISEWAGTCVTGGGLDWEAGCRTERAPARYVPAAYADGYSMGSPPLPFNFLHKLVANSPVVWELATCLAHTGMDADTFTGTSSMNFLGYITYSWLRRDTTEKTYPLEDGLHIINSDDDNPTTVFIFEWNGAGMDWRYRTSTDIFNGSMWGFAPLLPMGSPWGAHFRVMSSETPIMTHKVYGGLMHGGGYNDMGTLGVCRETGNLVNADTPSTFYIFGGHLPGANDVCLVGNVGPEPAVYDIYRYRPFDPLAPNLNPENLNVDLVGNAGSWSLVGGGTVDSEFMPGSVNPGNPLRWNPHVYGDEYDSSTFSTRYRLYRVVLKSGGPIQVYCGRNIIDRYSGGAMLHPAGPEPGKQTGMEYWLHTNTCAHQVQDMAVEVLNAFCPRIGQSVNCRSSDGDGYDSTYSTGEVDQCIAFKAITVPQGDTLRNWQIRSVDSGDIIVQYICLNITEKFYTAPFLRRGTYYEFIVPPVVYADQPFWMTVVVVSTSGGTKTEYCGTTNFTSTDPETLIELAPMELYSYDWTSDLGGCPGLPSDDGVRVFLNVVLSRLGIQSIVGVDVSDGSITGMATIQVVGVNVRFFKEPRIGIAASGDTVTFKICYSNYSTASARDFVITDRVPDGFTYEQATGRQHLCGTTDEQEPIDWHVAYSQDDAGLNYLDLDPDELSPPDVKWLKWMIPTVGINETGCACFTVKVN